MKIGLQITKNIELMLPFYTRALPLSLVQLKTNQLLYVDEAPDKPVGYLTRGFFTDHVVASS